MPEKLLVQPPRRIPLWIRLSSWIAERKTRRELLPPRILAWYPKAALSSGIMEVLVSHGEGRADARLLKLVRIQVSLHVGCPFCTEMNTSEADEHHITERELAAMQNEGALEAGLFPRHEFVALTHARHLTATPPIIDEAVAEELRQLFNERELVIISTTIAQVNYWARLLRSLRVPMACPIGAESGHQK